MSSSIATIEFENGSYKKSRQLFKTSLRKPNDNSLAQVEWAVSHKPDIPINRNLLGEIKNDFEAQAIYNFKNNLFENALIASIDWICDMPFTRRPILIGSHIAFTHLKEYKIAAKILKIGLKANPNDPTILNNLAYTYALDDDISNAENIMGIIDKLDFNNFDESTKICITATKGLIAYRKKDHKEGEFLYKKAIDSALLLKKETPVYYWKAMLNYIREELMISDDFNKNLLVELDKINEDDLDTDITALKNDIISIYNKRFS